MRKHTIVIDGGQLGAVIAVALAFTQCGLSDPGWYIRRDGRAQVYAYAPEEDKGARARWVTACRRTGLTVAPAPWERPKDAAAKGAKR